MRRTKEVKKKSGKKTVGRIGSFLLSESMIVGGLTLSPLTTVEVQAETTTKNVNLRLVDNSIAGIGNPTSGTSGATNWEGAKVYYGNMVYYALDKDGGLPGNSSLEDHMLLLSEGVINDSSRSFDTTEFISNWTISSIRTDLNHKSTSDGYFDTKFTATEQEAIGTTSISSSNTSSDYGVSYPSTSTGDKIFLLDLNDVQNTNYGFYGDNTRKATTPNCSKWWWLRSPGDHDLKAALIDNNGKVYSDGNTVFNLLGSSRPAFNLNLSSVLFTSESGKDKSDTFTATSDESGISSWKLTLKGSGSINSTKTNGNTNLQSEYAAETLTIAHSKAITLTDATQVSAMLTDSNGTVLYYGKVNNDNTAINSTVTIPVGLSVGSYSLYVFAEDINDENKTDYASDLGTPIPVTVGNPPTPPAPHNNDSDNGSDSNSNDGSSSGTKEEAYVNPLVWNYAANQKGSLCLIDHQGPICVEAFNQATPKGFKEAFSFNLLLKKNGYFKPSYVKKTGNFVLTIPKEWQKKGRTFMLIGIDKFGKTKTFSDMDLSDKTFTTTLDVEGYAFSLIYKDALAKNKWVYITRQ